MTDRVTLCLARDLLKTLTQHISKESEWLSIKVINHRAYLSQRDVAMLHSLIKIHVCTIDTKGMYLS